MVQSTQISAATPSRTALKQPAFQRTGEHLPATRCPFCAVAGARHCPWQSSRAEQAFPVSVERRTQAEGHTRPAGAHSPPAPRQRAASQSSVAAAGKYASRSLKCAHGLVSAAGSVVAPLAAPSLPPETAGALAGSSTTRRTGRGSLWVHPSTASKAADVQRDGSDSIATH
jgi:hypothetical protein